MIWQQELLLCDLAIRFSFTSKLLTLLSFFPSLCKMFTSAPMATESSLNNPSGMHMCPLETEPIVLGISVCSASGKTNTTGGGGPGWVSCKEEPPEAIKGRNAERGPTMGHPKHRFEVFWVLCAFWFVFRFGLWVYDSLLLHFLKRDLWGNGKYCLVRSSHMLRMPRVLRRLGKHC